MLHPVHVGHGLADTGSDMDIALVSLRGILKPSWIWKSWNIDLDIIFASGQLSCK